MKNPNERYVAAALTGLLSNDKIVEEYTNQWPDDWLEHLCGRAIEIGTYTELSNQIPRDSTQPPPLQDPLSHLDHPTELPLPPITGEQGGCGPACCEDPADCLYRSRAGRAWSKPPEDTPLPDCECGDDGGTETYACVECHEDVIVCPGCMAILDSCNCNACVTGATFVES